jgi:fumarate hydratase class II
VKDIGRRGHYMEKEFRVEKDTIGEVRVPKDKYWGAQTQRSRENFNIGTEQMPLEVIRAFANLKKCAANANYQLGKLHVVKKDVIEEAANEILAGKLDDQFPLVVWQTGSGTQTNMNVNEVIAFRSNQLLKLKKLDMLIHPNDDVNMSQSSNDTFPTAMHIAATLQLKNSLIPSIQKLKTTLQEKQKEFNHVVKIGRTHLQDATPITVGQEISGWVGMLERSDMMINEASKHILNLAIGGTAVGTGINAHPLFGEMVAALLSKETSIPFVSSTNKFHALTSHDELVHVHGTIKALAADLMKIANDIRWLSSGPRCGIGEMQIPANEPGSSIMPGKVNPTQSEALTMVACQVFGNDTTIGFAASQGNFELNVFKPVIIYNVIQSIRILSDAMNSFNDYCATGIELNLTMIKKYLHESLMLVTALNPHIGYENAAKIAKLAYTEKLTLKEAAKKTGLLTEEEFDRLVIPEEMVNPKA